LFFHLDFHLHLHIAATLSPRSLSPIFQGRGRYETAAFPVSLSLSLSFFSLSLPTIARHARAAKDAAAKKKSFTSRSNDRTGSTQIFCE
jgi:hypothetical protein